MDRPVGAHRKRFLEDLDGARRSHRHDGDLGAVLVFEMEGRLQGIEVQRVEDRGARRSNHGPGDRVHLHVAALRHLFDRDDDVHEASLCAVMTMIGAVWASVIDQDGGTVVHPDLDEVEGGRADVPVEEQPPDDPVEVPGIGGGALATVELTALLCLGDDVDDEGEPEAVFVRDGLVRPGLLDLVGIEYLQDIAGDLIPYIGELEAGEFEEAGFAVRLLEHLLFDAAVVCIDLPELFDDDVALCGVVVVEAPFGRAGMVCDPLDRDRFIPVGGEEVDGAASMEASRSEESINE